MADTTDPGPAGERPDSSFATRLKELRTASGLSQRALAKASGVAQAGISALESGMTAAPDLSTIRRLADALGTTVAALTGDADEAPLAAPLPAGIMEIPHHRLHRSDLNPRRHFDQEQLESLADSIAEQGLQTNLLARPHPDIADDFLLIAGERRWRAIGILIQRGTLKPDHPVLTKVISATDSQHRAMAIVENLQREQVPPLDEARSFSELLTAGWSTEEIAKAISKTPRHVQLRLALLEHLGDRAMTALDSGAIILNVARALTKAPVELQDALLDRIAAGEIATTEQVEAAVRLGKFPVSRALFDPAAYTGPRAADPSTGEELLLDRAEVEALQANALRAKRAELEGVWAWVERTNTTFWTPGLEDGIVAASAIPPEESARITERGAVIRVDPATLEVAIFTDLVAPDDRETAAPPGDEEHDGDDDDDGGAEDSSPTPPSSAWTARDIPADPVVAVSYERKLYACHVRTAALQSALLTHPDAWMHQLTLALMGCRDVADIIVIPPNPQNAVVSPGVRAVLGTFRVKLGGDAVFQPLDAGHLLLLPHPDNAQSTTETAMVVLTTLRALPMEEQFELLAALTASRCATRFLAARTNLGDSPMVLAAAEASRADTSSWRPDADYLATLTDAQLGRFAAHHGIFEIGVPPAEGRTALVAAILAAARKPGWDHLPPELTFATRAAVEDALRRQEED